MVDYMYICNEKPMSMKLSAAEIQSPELVSIAVLQPKGEQLVVIFREILSSDER